MSSCVQVKNKPCVECSIIIFFFFIFLCVFVYMYLCRPSEASTQYCAIRGGYPPQDWQSLPYAGEELDSNPGLLICSQVRYHWAIIMRLISWNHSRSSQTTPLALVLPLLIFILPFQIPLSLLSFLFLTFFCISHLFLYFLQCLRWLSCGLNPS